MNADRLPAVTESLVAGYRQALLDGDRQLVRSIIDRALVSDHTAAQLVNELVWPTMEELRQSYKEDQITLIQLYLATRLIRTTAESLCRQLDRKPANGQTVLIFCGDDEPEELGGQLCADLFEADGWTVRFAGGGVPSDEILALIGEHRPKLVVQFATLAQQVPDVRRLIDYLRDVNSCPNMQVMCCGGIYQRAEGLAEEIGADLYAPDAAEAVRIANEFPDRKATVDQQTVGRMRRIRKAESRRVADEQANVNTAA